MTFTIRPEGRNLHIHVEGLEPYVVRPLPANAAQQVTATYLRGLAGDATTQEIADALCIALDGGEQIDGDWYPVLKADRTNANRAGIELRLVEIETLALVAFLWGSALGFAGAQTYLDDGAGIAGQVRAAGALVTKLGFSPLASRSPKVSHDV